METYLLVHVPTAVLGACIVAVTTGLAVLGLVVVRKRVPVSTLEAHHDVAGFILAVVGVVYAVLLAFVVVISWEQLRDAQATAENEAATVASIYQDGLAFGPRGEAARSAVARYAESVVNVEWKQMADHHDESEATATALDTTWKAFTALQPTTPAEVQFSSNAVTGLQTVSELRQSRLLASGEELPAPLWAVLILGAAISVGFTYLFGVPSFRAQALMVGALASTVGLVLFLVLSLDLPFTGDISVGPVAMAHTIRDFNR
jgi:hypothetical protein